LHSSSRPRRGSRAPGGPDEPGRGSHVVQLYEGDAFLLDQVSRFIVAGFDAGDGLVVIAEEPHVADLEARLASYGIDVPAASAQGRYVALDARQILREVSVDGRVDRERFLDVVEGTLARVAENRAQVRAFGEIVAVLWRDGRHEEALRLERFWNELTERMPLALLCAYPVRVGGCEPTGALLHEVCDQHTEVVPAESYTALVSSDARLRAVTQLQHETDAFARERSERARLAAIVESSDDAIIGKTLDGIVTSWNDGARRIFGYTAKEAIGNSILILIPPDRYHEETDILTRIRRGKRIDHFETVRRRKDGSLVDVSLTSSPVKDGQGRIIGISKIARDITERKQAEERLRLLAREVDHRGKNTLALVQAIVRMTRAETVPDFVRIATGRIGALARVHTLLAASSWRGADLRQLVEEELAPYGANDAARVRVAGPDLALRASAAQALAMALHELATNAVKYGALSVPHGAVSVQWVCDGRSGFTLHWSETGGPAVSAPDRSGTGTGVIERAVRSQLGGEVDFDWRADGLVCRIAVPASQLAQGRSVA